MTFNTIICSCILLSLSTFTFFFFNDTATTEIYTLSLHDALPISIRGIFADFGCGPEIACREIGARTVGRCITPREEDRKSTRLNSSHVAISYAVFCLKKKKKKKKIISTKRKKKLIEQEVMWKRVI